MTTKKIRGLFEATGEDVWYFAYGSNMSIDQKEERTGKIREARRAILKDYRFAFNKRSSDGTKANIISQSGSEVWGVIYRCNWQTIELLNKFEGVLEGHYQLIDVKVFTDSQETIGALTYSAGPDYICNEGRPTESYMKKILNGAEEHWLPVEYIEKIKILGKQGQ